MATLWRNWIAHARLNSPRLSKRLRKDTELRTDFSWKTYQIELRMRDLNSRRSKRPPEDVPNQTKRTKSKNCKNKFWNFWEAKTKLVGRWQFLGVISFETRISQMQLWPHYGGDWCIIYWTVPSEATNLIVGFVYRNTCEDLEHCRRSGPDHPWRANAPIVSGNINFAFDTKIPTFTFWQEILEESVSESF